MKKSSGFLFLILYTTTGIIGYLNASSCMKQDTQRINEILVTATRITSEKAVTFQTIGQEEIEATYFGQDPSVLIQSLSPSVVSFSDAGTDIGNYVQFRMRGMDQTRINTSLNGVPLNDMIDQGVFFSNFSDFGGAIGRIQLQRGVGLTNGGISAYAGALSFSSPDVFGDRQGGKVNLIAGSFDTRRIAAQYHTGLNDNGSGFYARMSRTITGGYKRHSGSDAYSIFATGGYSGENDVLLISLFGGKTQNDQSYLPVLLSDINADPRTNYNHPNDTDDFEQEMVQIRYGRALSPEWSTTQTLYYGGARGIFPFGLDDTTQLLFGIDNNHFGAISEWKFTGGRWNMNAGLHGYTFNRENKNYTAPNISRPDYADETTKNEVALFAQTTYSLERFDLQMDIQMRHVALNFAADEILSFGGPVPAGKLMHSRKWTFFNPRIGLHYRIATNNSLYASWGKTSREPTRTDILQGDGSSINEFNLASVLDDGIVMSESAHDFELGLRSSWKHFNLDINFFHMYFDQEISQVGALAANSYVPLRQNIPESRRTGMELLAEWFLSTSWSIGTKLAFLDTRVSRFETTSGSFVDVEHIFAPKWMISNRLAYRISSGSEVQVSSRYLGESFMELSNDPEFVIPESFVIDLGLTMELYHSLHLRFLFNNVFDELYFTDGAPVDLDFDGLSEGPGYRIQPPRNIQIGLSLDF